MDVTPSEQQREKTFNTCRQFLSINRIIEVQDIQEARQFSHTLTSACQHFESSLPLYAEAAQTDAQESYHRFRMQVENLTQQLYQLNETSEFPAILANLDTRNISVALNLDFKSKNMDKLQSYLQLVHQAQHTFKIENITEEKEAKILIQALTIVYIILKRDFPNYYYLGESLPHFRHKTLNIIDELIKKFPGADDSVDTNLFEDCSDFSGEIASDNDLFKGNDVLFRCDLL